MKFSLLRFTNTALLAAVLILTLTGIYGLFWTLQGWLFDLHRLAGWSLIALIPWKTAISWRSLKRGLQPDFDRGVMILVSLLLALLTLLVIVLGVAWLWRLLPAEAWLRQTLISWHWMLALALLAPFALHAWRRWPRPAKPDLLSRRAALKMLGIGAVSVAGWWLAEQVAALKALSQAARRFTGSREANSFSGNDFPVTNGPGEGDQRIEIETWRLDVEARGKAAHSYTYQDLLDLPSEDVTATVDCTLGWYSTQVWKGIPLRDLIDSIEIQGEVIAVRLEAVSGYAQIFPLQEARQILLATHVGGETLEHPHGFPLRAVVPSRRGWFWVKWLARIDVIAV
ncbi:MAG: hypothetical protein EHM70_12310 [Chloroflexota bacterium]|nr:MAG: hypothetical protein EHM70_12310 [Chloroflexota bacterium]